MVARAIPDAWRFSAPELIVAARYDSADVALHRLLGDATEGPAIEEAARLAYTAASACDVAGRALFAAHMRLWHATTLLREYRGDGHVAALLAGGIDGCEAHVTLVGTGAVSREAIQPHRGWSDEEWEAAETRLCARGWLDDSKYAHAGWPRRPRMGGGAHRCPRRSSLGGARRGWLRASERAGLHAERHHCACWWRPNP